MTGTLSEAERKRAIEVVTAKEPVKSPRPLKKTDIFEVGRKLLRRLVRGQR